MVVGVGVCLNDLGCVRFSVKFALFFSSCLFSLYPSLNLSLLSHVSCYNSLALFF